jgi:hypothetical protein
MCLIPNALNFTKVFMSDDVGYHRMPIDGEVDTSVERQLKCVWLRVRPTVVSAAMCFLIFFYHFAEAGAMEQEQFLWNGITWRVPSGFLHGPHSAERESFELKAGWRDGAFSHCCNMTSGAMVTIIVHKGQLRDVGAVASSYSNPPQYPPLPIRKFRYAGSSAATDFYTYDIIKSGPHPISLTCPANSGSQSVERSLDDCRIDIAFSDDIYFIVFVSASQRASAATIADQVIDLLMPSRAKSK